MKRFAKKFLVGAAAGGLAVLPGCHIEDTYPLEWGRVHQKIVNVTGCDGTNWPQCIEYVLVLRGVASHGHNVEGRQPTSKGVFDSCAEGDYWLETSSGGYNGYCRP